MRLHCFSTGVARLKAGERGARRYLPGGWRDETLPVNVFAIEHPDGICLFDAGQTADAALPGYFPRWYPFFKLARFELTRDQEAASQLRCAALDPGDVRWLVLSHMHTDHVGGVAAFRRARILVSAVEWNRAVGLGGRMRGYLPQYWPAGVVPEQIRFSTDAHGLGVRSYDVAGDGRLLLIPTPGHTPGHLGLLGRCGSGSFFLAGDAGHSPAEIAATTPWLADLCAAEGATLLTSHEPGAASRLPEEVAA